LQRASPAARCREHNDVAGFIYAVLLALVVIAVWEEHEAAKATVGSEANELAEVFWLARRFQDPEGPRLQGLARSYARVVVEEEWPLVERGSSSPRAWASLDEMRLGVQDVGVSTPADQMLFEQGLDRVHGLADARRTRLVEADEGIPAVLWVVLVFGGIVTGASPTCSACKIPGRTGS
jgi:hypothetical protein